MKQATLIVHWPGKEVPACAQHAIKLMRIGEHMGCPVSVDFYYGELPCTNCENEAKKAAAE